MINSFVLLYAAMVQQGSLSTHKVQEIQRVFRELVELSKPTNLEKIRIEMAKGVLPTEDAENGFWSVGSAMTLIVYTNRGDFRGYSCYHVPRDVKLRSDEDLIAETKTVLKTIGFWGDSVSYSVERTEGADTQVSAYPAFRDMACLNNASVTFDSRSGALKRVFVWDRLDYQKYVDAPRVTPDQALDAAMMAYGGFHPFSAAEVGKPKLYFGIPASAELYDPQYHEISAEQMREFRNYVAMPLYYINIENAGDVHGYGESQCVVVDAISGRPIVIYPIGKRSIPDKKFVPWKVGDKVAVSSKSGKSLGFAVRGKPLPVAGVPVWIKVGGKLVDARYDKKSKQLWIGGDGAFTPGSALAKYLDQSAAPRKSFARKG
jgi:hypothetical protein